MLDRQITLSPYKKNVAYYFYKYEWQPIFHYTNGLHEGALRSTFTQLDNLLSYYSKVTVVLLQLHQPLRTINNDFLKLFLPLLKSQISLRYNKTRVAYAWAREDGKTGHNQHYHLALMLNGSLCKSGYYVVQDAMAIWSSLHSLNSVWVPKRNTFNVERYGNSLTLKKARMRMSYAAKKSTKETIPKGIRKFGFSQIKANKSIK